ncbi:uncharacterized protein [Salminus brasiliensis]|uniref:uncharacterized protein n=2 Tax=Salminus brasiliensis TaxID=930266 RepID=UPI003B835CC8
MSDVCSFQRLPAASVKAVVCTLKDGLVSINRVYEALINADVDRFSRQCRNYGYIREQILRAKQSLERSEQAAGAGLKSLDKNIEILTRDEGRLERKMRATQQTLENLRTEKESNEDLLQKSRDALEVARSNLSSARSTLRKQKKRENTAAFVTGVGVGLFIIPVAGWIAGSALVVGGITEMEEASEAIKVAEKEESESESDVEMYRDKVSDYKAEISQAKQDIRQNRDRKEQICTDIRKVKEQRAAVADLQVKVRRAVHILSVLSGRAKVVEGQTRRHIVLEPVMKVMEEVMKAAGEITGNQLLFNGDIPRLLDAMRGNNRKLAAICSWSSDAEDEGYY